VEIQRDEWSEPPPDPASPANDPRGADGRLARLRLAERTLHWRAGALLRRGTDGELSDDCLAVRNRGCCTPATATIAPAKGPKCRAQPRGLDRRGTFCLGIDPMCRPVTGALVPATSESSRATQVVRSKC
jgi:hypothetical protein